MGVKYQISQQRNGTNLLTEKSTFAIPDTKLTQAHILTDKGNTVHVTTTSRIS